MESVSHGWNIYGQLSKEQFQQARVEDIEPLYAQLLSNRGMNEPDKMRAFLDADYNALINPNELIDMRKAVGRIQQALSQGEYITVYGDYDADGVTSSALLFRALHSLIDPSRSNSKIPLDFYIPDRLKEGCGLNEGAINSIAEKGTRLIITTDCASSDVQQIKYAADKHIDVIVTDHHHPPAELPAAYAIVNPWRSDAPESNWDVRNLCGVGVAFKLVQALYLAHGRSLNECRDLLDLVAIGTIGDIVPLTGENHTLVRLGMEQLNKTTNPGLKALIRMSMLQPGRIRERDVAYALTPRINAAGRMEHARYAFELLTTESDDDAEKSVKRLEALNENRRQQTEELMRLVLDEADEHPDKVVVVSGKAWHEGILGLVAGRLVEKIHRPVFVLSEDEGTQLSRGSARSEKGFNIMAALRSFPLPLERYGGHAQAAGFTLKTELIEAFRKHLLAWDGKEDAIIVELVQANEENDIPVEPAQDVPLTEQENRPEKMIDLAPKRLDLFSYEGYKKLRKLAPFGAGNPEPTFLLEKARLLNMWTSGGKRNGEDKEKPKNLRMELSIGNSTTSNSMIVVGTWLRQAGRIADFERDTDVDVVVHIESSEDDTRREIWLKILDVWRAGEHRV